MRNAQSGLQIAPGSVLTRVRYPIRSPIRKPNYKGPNLPSYRFADLETAAALGKNCEAQSSIQQSPNYSNQEI